jgi:hypothetical protein
MALTIAIPTMNRWIFLKDTLPIYLARPEVREVIVCDETGEDVKAILASSFGKNPKLRLITNERRLGIYQNKRKCLSEAQREAGSWVALLDSDNIFNDDWFETIATLDYSNIKQLYATADFKELNIQTGQLRYPAERFSGRTVTKSSWNSLIMEPSANFIINDGNWIIHSSAVKHLPIEVKSSDLHASDAIFMLRLFISHGYSITYVRDLEYIHTVHPGSSWLQTEKESTKIMNSTNWFI